MSCNNDFKPYVSKESIQIYEYTNIHVKLLWASHIIIDESIVCMVCFCAPSAGIESLYCTFLDCIPPCVDNAIVFQGLQQCALI